MLLAFALTACSARTDPSSPTRISGKDDTTRRYIEKLLTYLLACLSMLWIVSCLCCEWMGSKLWALCQWDCSV